MNDDFWNLFVARIFIVSFCSLSMIYNDALHQADGLYSTSYNIIDLYVRVSIQWLLLPYFGFSINCQFVTIDENHDNIISE